MEIQKAWDAGDRSSCAAWSAPDLLVEWERRLDDFDRRGWRNHVEPIGEPSVEYVGLNRRGDSTRPRHRPRRGQAPRLRRRRLGRHLKRAGRLSESVHLREFWTLKRNARGHWMLASIEQGAEGKHALNEEIIASADYDEKGMRDEAMVEGAVADAVPESMKSPRSPTSTSPAMPAPRRST